MRGSRSMGLGVVVGAMALAACSFAGASDSERGDGGDPSGGAIVRTWAAGGPFPARRKVVDPAGPLVLLAQPESAESPQTFRLSMTESGPETAPALTITTDC